MIIIDFGLLSFNTSNALREIQNRGGEPDECHFAAFGINGLREHDREVTIIIQFAFKGHRATLSQTEFKDKGKDEQWELCVVTGAGSGPVSRGTLSEALALLDTIEERYGR